MNKTIIKPCPRCGNHPQILKSVDWDSLTVDYYPECVGCKLTTLRMFETENLAILAWNDLELKKENKVI